MGNLVLVESPAKAKTIEKYLGKGYKVTATIGHVIDLPKNKLAVDVEHGYKPEFSVIKGKGTFIKTLKKEAPKYNNVYLAMDPDREGEAIAWHVAEALGLKDAKRITFHEITKSAVTEAIKTPSNINENLVQAQIARRVLDRLVGYKLSQLLWTKIWYGLSAGRVQSVALRLIVEREMEIESFKSEEFWNITASLINKDNSKVSILTKLSKKDGKKFVPANKSEADMLEADVLNRDFNLIELKKRDMNKNPFPPFTTSTLQQSANNVLGLSASRTMAIAQILYQAGYITYMRTDSVNLSAQALDAIRETIKSQYGAEYLPESPRYFKNRSRNAQEAHEAVRPSDFSVTSEKIKKEFGPVEAKLYDLIYRRTLACQMVPRKSEIYTLYFQCNGISNAVYTFTVGAEKIIFDGFRKAMPTAKNEDGELLQEISEVSKGDVFLCKDLIKEQNFTKPKARYSDASLVKALESYGVGRPSTYASIISTVVDRGYVEKIAKYLKPTDVGRVVTALLKNNFGRLVDYEYTAGVEDRLDKIAEGKVEYEPFIDREFKPLLTDLEAADKSIQKDDVVILGESDEKCEKCGSDMVIRLGRYGKFLSCTRFPECKGMKSLTEVEIDFEKFVKVEECPKCGKGMVLKSGKYGQFWACENYPECKGTVPMLLNEKCPDCGKNLVERKGRWGKSFTGCSGYPDCKYIKKEQKAAE